MLSFLFSINNKVLIDIWGLNGYVLSKNYPLSSIFAVFRSKFKNKPNNIYRHNGFYVRREHEMIVENIEQKYLKKGHLLRWSFLVQKSYSSFTSKTIL